MSTIHIDVVSAEESIYSGDAEFVVLPGIMGELGIYPRHAPLITQIRPGTVRIKVPGKEEEEMVYVQGGILEVQPDHINVLSDTAIRAADLDEAKVLEAKQQAEEALRARTEKQDIASVEAELAAISAQLQAIQKLRRIRELSVPVLPRHLAAMGEVGQSSRSEGLHLLPLDAGQR